MHDSGKTAFGWSTVSAVQLPLKGVPPTNITGLGAGSLILDNSWDAKSTYTDCPDEGDHSIDCTGTVDVPFTPPPLTSGPGLNSEKIVRLDQPPFDELRVATITSGPADFCDPNIGQPALIAASEDLPDLFTARMQADLVALRSTKVGKTYTYKIPVTGHPGQHITHPDCHVQTGETCSQGLNPDWTGTVVFTRKR
jgi:hypothetical protein